MDRLTSARVFIECVERGSIAAAAVSLGLSRSMASRHVAALEDWAHVRLLHRSTRRLSLTPAGEQALAYCKQLVEATAGFETLASPSKSPLRGTVRVSVSIAFGQQCLMQPLQEFLRLHPDVHVEVCLAERVIDLVEERIDIAIRVTADVGLNLYARRLGNLRSVLCAAPSYLSHHGTPATVEALASHNCLTHSHFGRSTWRFTHEGTEASVAVRGNLTVNDSTALLQVALHGGGLTVQPVFAVSGLLASDRLRALLTDWQPPELGVYAVYQSRRNPPRIASALLEFLPDYFDRHPIEAVRAEVPRATAFDRAA